MGEKLVLREGRRIHAGIDGTALDNPQYQAVEGMQRNEAEERTSLLAAEGHEALLRVVRSQLTRARPPSLTSIVLFTTNRFRLPLFVPARCALDIAHPLWWLVFS